VIGGALVGAWLGFNATEGLLALVTSIVGATVGANFILLALDFAWDLQARERRASADAEGALAARPLTGDSPEVSWP
jgi:hypothetical protein